MELKKKMETIKIKDFLKSKKAQKNYNDFFQKMVNAQSEDERNQIVEDRKKEVISKLEQGY